jgi:hypothetical protein
MDMEATRLTTGQMMALNHGKIILPATIDLLIKDYNMPACCLSKPYGNPHNPHFSAARADKTRASAAGRTMTARRTVAAHTDDHIFQDLRKAFASIVKGKDGTVLATMTINRMIIPISKVPEIADLFYQTMIQCPLQIDEYLKVLFALKRPGDSLEDRIRISLAKIAQETFNNPVKLKDTKISDGDTLTKNHREASCAIMAKLYAFNYSPEANLIDLSGPNMLFSNYEKLRARFIDPLVNEVKNGNADSIKLLANSLRTLSASKKYPELIADYKQQIKDIYNNVDFKLTARLAVKDFIDN